MSGRYLLDTNVFVYTFDDRAPDKRERAKELIATALGDELGVISFQVVQEFINVATRKFATPLSPRDCSRFLEEVPAPLWEVYPSTELYRLALDVQERWQYAFCDSLILAAASTAGCQFVYSEDFQDGQRIGGLTIENPFARI